MAAAYVIGIDLGTTNSVLAYVPLEEDEAQIELLPIPQLVSPGTIEERTSLPSFLYLAPPPEVSSGQLALPWEAKLDYVVGEMARRQSADQPERTVAGAKSWLCHSRVDRHQDILPWQAPADVRKISPVTASRRLLEHLKAAWNYAHPEAPFSEQQIVLTVPASFDASARELTREAAVAAGYPDGFVLLEEPQSAVYAWLWGRGDRWREELNLGDSLLVCDVGGGTTDLTLVSVEQEAGDLILKRVAVGRHLLVGGDNMDLALAHRVSELFAEQNVSLDPWQSVSLWHACRTAKETLLDPDAPETHPVSVLGRGSKLIGGTITVDVPHEVANEVVLDGFMPSCQLSDRPVRQRASGFMEIGLPYESDTALTRHIAAFLSDQAEAEAPRPTHVLFNGGVFQSMALRERLLAVLGEWFEDGAPEVLDPQADLNNAVARGAAYYGWTKHHGNVRIRGGTARSYYVGIETAGLAIPGAPRPLTALCVVPFGMEEGTQCDVPSGDIGLVVGEPALFRFFSSLTRKDDRPGTVVSHWSEGELSETDPLEALLPAEEGQEGEFVPVRFHATITELGVLELWCVHSASGQRWKLEFSIREDAQTEASVS